MNNLPKCRHGKLVNRFHPCYQCATEDKQIKELVNPLIDEYWESKGQDNLYNLAFRLYHMGMRNEHKQPDTQENADKTMGVKKFTFKEFVKYGQLKVGNIKNIPWSFRFEGNHVTHENDDCYLISMKNRDLKFTSRDILVLHKDGDIFIEEGISE